MIDLVVSLDNKRTAQCQGFDFAYNILNVLCVRYYPALLHIDAIIMAVTGCKL